MSLILHITPSQHWQQAQQAGSYRCESLKTEGFIHCSTPGQVVWVANSFYQGQPSLVLLCIDPAKVQAEIKYEGLEGGEQFPHIYGALNLDAVRNVLSFEPGEDGRFALPDWEF
jgi:uncharacterized protein (DUF952 family)